MTVTLVGAGPGDPELLTLRAVRALGECDLVLYDALVDPRVLEFAPRAQRFYVGKRSGRHSMSQSEISQLMIRAARAGRRVVRLKCGDPFVFGRGGEEAMALRDAGVDVAIVPGVSSALAAPAACGIPLTHRGVASGFVVLSAEPEPTWREVVGRGPVAALTYVFLMALGRRAEIAVFALDSGFSSALGAAVVLGATTERAWSWCGTLAELGAVTLPDAAHDLPGLVVVGEVVHLATAISAARSSKEMFGEQSSA